MITGMAGAWVVKVWGGRLRLMDHPNRRSSHACPTPKGGGVGLLGAFGLAAIFLRISPFVWGPAVCLSLIGLLGDRLELSSKLRLVLQFPAAFVFLAGTFSAQSMALYHLLLILPLSIFIVGTANFYNFMDGIDGIAAITGIVGFGLMVLFLIPLENAGPYRVLCYCMAFACLGFLPFNFPKARVFMGDTGSILLGFVFAGMVVWLSKSFLDFVCLSAFLFPFYADELTTMIVRLKEGENLTSPHRRHLYQLLANEMGITHWKVSTGYGLLQLVIGVNVLMIRPSGLLVVILLQVCCFAVFGWVSFFIRLRLKNLGTHQE